MYFFTILFGACAFASPLASSSVASELLNEVGHVIDGEGKVYQLKDTGHNNVRVITQERKDGYYIHPISYHVESAHACNFYSESTRGVGYLIGEFQGPLDDAFGSHWAAFYECWNEDLEPKSPPGLLVREEFDGDR